MRPRNKRNDGTPRACRPDDASALNALIAGIEDPGTVAVLDYVEARYAPRTIANILDNEKRFIEHLTAVGKVAFPCAVPDLVGYLETLRGRVKPATIDAYVHAIGHGHRRRGLEDPTGDAVVRAHVVDLKRSAVDGDRTTRPLPARDYQRLRSTIPLDARGRRDRLLAGLLYEGTLKCEEVGGIDVDDVTEHPKGLIVRIRSGSHPRRVEVRGYGEDDVVHDWHAWIALSGITSGPLVRGVDRLGRVSPLRFEHTVMREVLNKRLEVAGFERGTYSPRSFRAGYLREALQRDVSPTALAVHAGFHATRSLAPFQGPQRGVPLHAREARA